MASRKARSGAITVTLVRGRDLPMAVAARLGCKGNDRVECYRYHRPEQQ